MVLEVLRIENVRCVAEAELALGQTRNYIFGRNGAGKTSILESIYLLGRGRSFRTRHTGRLVRTGTDGFTVFGEVGDDQVHHRLGVAQRDRKLEARLDGAVAESLASLARLLPVYVIDPKLHQLIEAGPSERRRYVDSGVFHVEHDYLEAWRAYRRVLGQRNASLKAGNRRAGLSVWTQAFIGAAEVVDSARRRYVAGLAAAVRVVSKRLLGQVVDVEYRAGWRAGIGLAEALDESLERDMAAGFTQVGPHRADLKIRSGAGEVRDSASRGQQKLVAAALVIGQVSEFQRATGQRAMLLVDDPAAELDSVSLESLLEEIESLDAQSVLTGLNQALLQPDAGFPVFHVERGKVQSVL